MSDNRTDPLPDKPDAPPSQDKGFNPSDYWRETGSTTTSRDDDKKKQNDETMKGGGFSSASDLLGDETADKKEGTDSTEIESRGGEPKKGDGIPPDGKPDPDSKKTDGNSEKSDQTENGQRPVFVAELSEDKTSNEDDDKESAGEAEKPGGERKETISDDGTPGKDDMPKTDGVGSLTPDMKRDARKALGLPDSATDKEISDGIKGQVDKLKSDTYQERENAEQALRAMGPAAAEHLLAAVSQKGVDPELNKRGMGILRDIANRPTKMLEQSHQLSEIQRTNPNWKTDERSTQEIQADEAKADRMRDDFFNNPANARPESLTPKEAEERKHFTDLLGKYGKDGNPNVAQLQELLKSNQTREQGLSGQYARELATKAVKDFERAGGDAGSHEAKLKAHDTLARAMNVDKGLVNSDMFQHQVARTGADLNPRFRADYTRNGGADEKMAEAGNIRSVLRKLTKLSQK